jgi:hypothetical protein
MLNFENYNSDDKIFTYINKITVPVLKDFIIKSLEQYGSVNKLNKANKVADIVWQKFESANYVTENAQQQFVDITIAACLLYNLFYDEKDITTILKHRVKLNTIAKETFLDEKITYMIFDIIECQLGENHPVQRLKPTPNSPSQTFADAVWQINSYKLRM